MDANLAETKDCLGSRGSVVIADVWVKSTGNRILLNVLAIQKM